MKELIIKKCLKCGAKVEVINDCTCDNCGIKCCGENMFELVPNSVDAAIEKHVPVYEIVGNYIVAEVPHVMEDDHFIEYIALVSDDITAKKYFKPGETPKAVFPYIKGSVLYESCNKHGIWKAEVK